VVTADVATTVPLEAAPGSPGQAAAEAARRMAPTRVPRAIFPLQEEAMYRAGLPLRRGTVHATFLFAAAGNMVDKIVEPVIFSLIFTLLGIIVFGAAFFAITKLSPFSIRKEIEEDQNTALGIVIGCVILGLAIIISSAIKG
jgi:putative membrane protein